MEVEKEYKHIVRDYEDFLGEFKRIVEKIIARHQIPIAFGISARVKTVDSILEKISSERATVKKSITELKDLVGLRIVLLFPEFKDKVVDILKAEFKSLNDPNRPNLNTSEFGYSSVHLVLGIKDEWTRTPDWESHSNKKIEVQVRTLSEHIWAETSHSLFYKREENIPTIIKRDLSKLKALLEVVDDKLHDIKDKVEHHFKEIASAPYEEILNLDLNSETFKRVMKKHSKGLYKLNDLKNKVLSSKIESTYNLLMVEALDTLLEGNIDPTDLDQEEFIDRVIGILDREKSRIDNQQKDTYS